MPLWWSKNDAMIKIPQEVQSSKNQPHRPFNDKSLLDLSINTVCISLNKQSNWGAIDISNQFPLNIRQSISACKCRGDWKFWQRCFCSQKRSIWNIQNMSYEGQLQDWVRVRGIAIDAIIFLPCIPVRDYGTWYQVPLVISYTIIDLPLNSFPYTFSHDVTMIQISPCMNRYLVSTWYHMAVPLSGIATRCLVPGTLSV